jgi:ribosome maturation factor RimP
MAMALKRASTAPRPAGVGAAWAKVPEQVRALAAPLLAADGFELVHVECQREQQGRVLRLYVDKPGGVTLSDCAHISRQVGDLLDIYLEHVGAYALEVSSPGSERPLGQEADFERFAGRRVRIRTIEAIDGQRNFSGTLLGLSDGNLVRLRIKDTELSIPMQQIRKARLADSQGP